MIFCPAAYYSGMFSEARLPGVQNVPIEEIRTNGAWQMLEEAWAKNLNAHFLGWGFDNAQIFYTYFLTKPKESRRMTGAVAVDRTQPVRDVAPRRQRRLSEHRATQSRNARPPSVLSVPRGRARCAAAASAPTPECGHKTLIREELPQPIP